MGSLPLVRTMSSASELARRLAREAEAVCRHYLSNGRRQGRYWVVGNVANEKGRSLFVRLTGPTAGRGAAGHWTDAALLEHGDLLDLIRLNQGFDTLRDTLAEARRFLGMPRPNPPDRPAPGSPDAARRLFAASRPIAGTLAEAYLRSRGITADLDLPALRYHPTCFYREHDAAPRQRWPALIAAVTDLDGRLTGVQRTWLARDGSGKAPLASPRRALGALLGNGVRFGTVHDVMAAGEGIETMLSLRSAFPHLPAVAALSASHLAALLLPSGLRRLYIVCDDDAAGRRAAVTRGQRARAAGISTRLLMPVRDDLNADLRTLGVDALRARLAPLLAPEDRDRCLAVARR